MSARSSRVPRTHRATHACMRTHAHRLLTPEVERMVIDSARTFRVADYAMLVVVQAPWHCAAPPSRGELPPMRYCCYASQRNGHDIRPICR